MTESTTTTTPDLLAEARRLEPLIDEHGPDGDERGALADEVVDALHDAGIFGMWVPRSLGGSELDPIASIEVIEQLAYADASTGWVAMAAGLAIGTGGAYLGDEAVNQIFGGERFPVIAGQGTRPGSAVPADGGHLLSGSWQFASGIKHSGFIHTLGVVEGTGEPRIFVLPVEQATLIDNWDVLGLRATGSIDYKIDSVFVPEHFSHFALAESSERGGDFYRLGIINIAGICHSSWALGVGRRMLDELRKSAQAKAGRPGQIAESDAFHQGYAAAEGTYRAARALIFETWRDVAQTLERGDDLSTEQKTLIRLGTVHVTRAAQEVARFVYASGGTTALRAGTIQRFFRDMHAGTQHIIPGPGIQATVGRQLAGLAEGQQWQFLELVDPA
jgi:alkylation response protein AidB-like acyl-CoA dehydrogenase